MDKIELDSDSYRFIFEPVGPSLVQIEMYRDSWPIANPIYSKWLLRYILGNPRGMPGTNQSYYFSPSPGDMTVRQIMFTMTPADAKKLYEFVEEG